MTLMELRWAGSEVIKRQNDLIKRFEKNDPNMTDKERFEAEFLIYWKNKNKLMKKYRKTGTQNMTPEEVKIVNNELNHTKLFTWGDQSTQVFLTPTEQDKMDEMRKGGRRPTKKKKPRKKKQTKRRKHIKKKQTKRRR
jgi:hypothetical protein